MPLSVREMGNSLNQSMRELRWTSGVHSLPVHKTVWEWRIHWLISLYDCPREFPCSDVTLIHVRNSQLQPWLPSTPLDNNLVTIHHTTHKCPNNEGHCCRYGCSELCWQWLVVIIHLSSAINARVVNVSKRTQNNSFEVTPETYNEKSYINLLTRK